MFAGTVTEVHTSLDTERGRYVKVVSNGYTAIYQHLASVNVSYGSNIAKGAVIGVIGGSGLYNENAYGKHLHFEVWHNSNIDDPLKYFD